MVVVLESLVHIPTRSTLVDLDLRCGPRAPPLTHQVLLPSRTLDYYAQIFAPSLRRLTLHWTPNAENMPCGSPFLSTVAYHAEFPHHLDDISLNSFANLKHLQFTVDGTHWLDVAGFLRPIPAHLDTLVIYDQYKDEVVERDLLVKEDGEVKAMKINGLELLEPVLSLDSFKDLRYLLLMRSGYQDTLGPISKSMLQAIQRKLPVLHSRASSNIQLEFQALL